jgi:hypothetical protein
MMMHTFPVFTNPNENTNDYHRISGDENTKNEHDDSEECVHPAALWRRPKKRVAGVALTTGFRVLAFDVGQIHLAACILVVDLTQRPPFKIESWEMINLETSKVRQAVDKLCSVAKTKLAWLTVDAVVIEQQARINVKMVAMSHALQAILTILNPSVTPKFASSACKFSIFENMKHMDTNIIQIPKSSDTTYVRKRIRKANAVRLARECLEALPDHEQFELLLQLTNKDQQDDLADAFVYASAFIYKNEPFVKPVEWLVNTQKECIDKRKTKRMAS